MQKSVGRRQGGKSERLRLGRRLERAQQRRQQRHARGIRNNHAAPRDQSQLRESAIKSRRLAREPPRDHVMQVSPNADT
jgi:hypothetical protein